MKIQVVLSNLNSRFTSMSKAARIMTLAAAAVVVFMAFNLLARSPGNEIVDSPLVSAVRGDLEIIVAEEGNVEALQSQHVESEIRDRNGVQILYIVDEGYEVTQEDIDNGKILVELDAAQLEERRVNQEISLESAESTYTERRSQLEMRRYESITSRNSANQAVRFARLDLERFLGSQVADELTARLGIDERLAQSEALFARNRESRQADRNMEQRIALVEQNRQRRLQNRATASLRGAMASDNEAGAYSADDERFQSTGDALTAIGVEALVRTADGETESSTLLMNPEYLALRAQVDFSAYADETLLGEGQARQRLRTLQENVRVAEEAFIQSQSDLEGRRRLAERDYITPNDLEAQRSRTTQAESRLEQANTELDLYLNYTFVKEADEMLANLESAIMSYQRSESQAAANVAQAEARYNAARRQLLLQQDRLDWIEEQLDHTVIRAERLGMVVYGTPNRNQDPIQVGTTVRRRQTILTIPDMTEMAVQVDIHESFMRRVRRGQPAEVRISSFSSEPLAGTVTRVSAVADSGAAFQDPDRKVYPATVSIEGAHNWMRPGMRAEVEILVDVLEDVIYVPVGAVTHFGGEQVVFVADGGRWLMRTVEVGMFSSSHIEIKSGLDEGEQVMMIPPTMAEIRS